MSYCQGCADRDARIHELERRARLAVGGLRCGGCGGPHRFDTSVPSAPWNRVIRAAALSDYLCTTCIVRAFVRADESFTATLWGDDFSGVPIEVRVRGEVARDAMRVSEENTRLRAAILGAHARLAAIMDEVTR